MRRLIRHPIGWLFLFFLCIVTVYWLYWDQRPVEVVQTYVHSVAEGKWSDAKAHTIGGLRNKLEELSANHGLDHVQTATILQESYTLSQQDLRKQISEVHAKVVVRLPGGKVDLQDQVYSLYRSNETWQIYRIDLATQQPEEGNLYPIGFGLSGAQDTILTFLTASGSGEWAKAQQLLSGDALQSFEKTMKYLPTKWAKGVSIDQPTLQYVGRSLTSDEYNYLVRYQVKNQGKLKQMVARFGLRKWDGVYYINRTEVINETQG
ncbi:hypothetical protein [Aneurinibacillus terranovensis]|uniref:hypothetical protein n=1 Tax=Aneurinibacillus terranovensis TaxID=278991 RepID=UPI00040742FB|nr:hypothetical protein [Aneurinibacillus terranovensis]